MPHDGSPSRFSGWFALRLLCVFLVAVPVFQISAQSSEADGEAGEVDGESEAPAVEEPVAIPLGDVPTQSIELEEELNQIDSQLAPPAFVEELGAIVEETSDEIEVLDQQIERLSGQLVGKDSVTEQMSIVSLRSSKLSDYQEQLADHATVLQQSRERLEALKEVWMLTQEAAIEGSAPGALLEDIASQLEYLDTLDQRAQLTLEGNLSGQEQLSQALRELREREAQLFEIYNNLRTQLFERDSRPIWSIFGSSESQYVIANYADHTDVATTSIRRFYNSNRSEFSALFVYFIIVLGFLLYIRYGLNEKYRSDSRLEPMNGFAVLWLATAFLVAYFIRPFLLPTAPTAWRLLFNLVALVSMFCLVPLLVSSKWTKLVRWTLVIPFFLFVVQLVVAEESLIGRVIVLGAGVTLSVVFRRIWKTAKERNSSSLVRLGSYVGFLVSVVSVAANLLGYGALSDLLVQALIRSGMLALLVVFGFRVLVAAFRTILIVTPLNRMSSIQADLPLFEKHFSYILKWIFSLLWIVQVLALFSIFDIVFTAIVGFFSYTFEAGSLSISVGAVTLFFFTVWVSVLISRTLRYFLSTDILPHMRLDRGAPDIILMMLHYSVISLGFVLALGMMGVELQQISILIGALGVGIGLGLQDLVNNFVSGLILAFERPIKNGDKIEFGGTFGEVKHIGIRASVVRAFDGADTIVPNGHLVSREVINWTFRDQQRRIEVKVGVAYGTSPEKVLEILKSVALSNDEILKDPAPLSSFDGFGDSSLDFTLRCWTSEFGEFIRLRSEMNVAVYRALEEAGITIPFPQRDVHLRMVRNEG